MSNPGHIRPKEIGTVKDFRRSKATRAVVSVLCLAGFIVSVFITTPLFFTHSWLIIPLLLTLLFTKSYGAWEAYTKMREQTDVMQAELDALNREVNELENKKQAATNV